MFQRINILKIILDHLKTLRGLNQKGKGFHMPDFILFFLIPGVLSLLFTYYHFDLESQITNLISVVAIFGGFLFNLLAIIYGVMDKFRFDVTNDSLKKRFAKEIHSNISFCIVLSVFIVISLLTFSYKPFFKSFQYMDEILVSINYFLLILFLLSLLMVLNRVYILLKREMEEGD